MNSTRLTVRVPESVTTRLRRRSKEKGATESELVREALERFLDESSVGYSAYELAEEAGIVGIVEDAPTDLSTSDRHFKGFGKGK